MRPSHAFEDLVWFDAKDESRMVAVVHRDDRPVHKWEVVELTPQCGLLSLRNGASLRKAIEFAQKEVM